MRIFKVTDSFSFSETSLELASSSLKYFKEISFVTFSPTSLDFLGYFSFKILPKMHITIYAITNFDIMDFKAEGLIQKVKTSLKN